MIAKSAKTNPASGIEISILVPVMNESGNIAPLVDEICAALAGRTFEIIYVDDASNDDSLAELAATAARVPQLRVLRHEARAGQSAAIQSALLASRGTLIGVLRPRANPARSAAQLGGAACSPPHLPADSAGTRADRQTDSWGGRPKNVCLSDAGRQTDMQESKTDRQNKEEQPSWVFEHA